MCPCPPLPAIRTLPVAIRKAFLPGVILQPGCLVSSLSLLAHFSVPTSVFLPREALRRLREGGGLFPKTPTFPWAAGLGYLEEVSAFCSTAARWGQRHGQGRALESRS